MSFAEPDQTRPNRPKPNQTEPNQTKMLDISVGSNGCKRSKLDDGECQGVDGEMVCGLKRQVTEQTALILEVLQAACEHGCAIIVETVMQRCPDLDLNVQYGYGRTLLLDAIEFNHPAVVADLLGYNADVNFTPFPGRNPLYHAIMSGHAEIVDTLLRHGASLRSNTHTALGFACKANKLSVVKVLIKHGSKIDARDWYGATALMVAASSEHVGDGETVLYLIAEHANCDLEMPNGTTALSLANPQLAKKMQTAIMARGQADSMEVV